MRAISVISAAAAALVSVSVSAQTAIPISNFNGTFGSFTNSPDGVFTIDYTFTVPTAGTVSATLQGTGDIVFTGVTLNGVQLRQRSFGAVQNFDRLLFPVVAGGQVFHVEGAGPGSYTGTVTFMGAAAVPEPAAWVMMVSGVGLVGGAMRRRTKVRVSRA